MDARRQRKRDRCRHQPCPAREQWRRWRTLGCPHGRPVCRQVKYLRCLRIWQVPDPTAENKGRRAGISPLGRRACQPCGFPHGGEKRIRTFEVPAPSALLPWKCPLRCSNPRPDAFQASALPSELKRQENEGAENRCQPGNLPPGRGACGPSRN